MRRYMRDLDKILRHPRLDESSMAPAAPVAPTQPKPGPATKPGPPKTPLIPKVPPKLKPGPRARAVTEAYERFVNPNNQRMFTHGHDRVGFSYHPLMLHHGEALAKSAYEHSSNKVYSAFPGMQDQETNRKISMLTAQTGQALQTMTRLEAPHKEELKELAVDAVMRAFAIPEDYRSLFAPELQYPQYNEGEDRAEDEEDETDEAVDMGLPEQGAEDDIDEDEDYQDQVNKRYTMNLISQGAAIHNMHDLHMEEYISQRLEQIEPRLNQLYSQFGRGSSHHYWLYDINHMVDVSLGGAMGLTWLTPQGEEGAVKINAQAPVFPVLVQELIKGWIMLLSHHQFEGMDEKRARRIMKKTDTLGDEFPQIMIGPKVWTSLVKALPREYKGRLSEVVSALAKAHPQELHEIISRLGDAIVTNDKLEESSAASALRDLLDRTLRTNKIGRAHV